MKTRYIIQTIILKTIAICTVMIADVTKIYAVEQAKHLCINEIMQSNINTVFVEMEFPDSWVELYNPTDMDININHYYFSPTPDYKDGYCINSNEEVPAGDFFLVFFDKVGKGCHANFRLNSVDSGMLFLFNEKGVLLDSLYYPAMPAPNIAYARNATDHETWQYVNKATPNACNIVEATDILLPQPLFSIRGHVMTENETLTISIPQEPTLPDDTHLYLSFNGNEPDTSAICIAGSDTTFVIDKSTVVRARLISSHALCPPSRTESFIFHPRPTDIPIISLVTDDSYLYSDSLGIFSSKIIVGNTKHNYAYNWRRPLNMEYLGSAGESPLFNQMGETGMFGNSTRSAQQKSMKLISNKRFGTKHLKGHFWPDVKPKMKKQKAICLRSCTTGSRLIEGLMQNWFGMHMPDLDYQAFAPAIVYINGEYKGFMGLREKSDEDYVWANYDKLEDIEMIEALNATKPASFKNIKDAILSGNATYEDMASCIDMANTADITAIQTICSDTDWPYNNVSMWRPLGDDGKWRWIMKDMDMINVAFRCTDPLTFNYLKFLTNTGEAGSQEYSMHQTSSWIWPRMQLMGKLLYIPEFRDLLIDRLQVFMGDFMRWDVLEKYLNERYEALNTEATQSLLMLKTGGKNTFLNSIQKDIDFFRNRPAEICRHLTDFYNLGYTIPMTTVGYGQPVAINDIPLTEGDFNGTCFSNRAIRLDSGDEHIGWYMHVKNENDIANSYCFESAIISVIPRDYLLTPNCRICSIEFETFEIEGKTSSNQSITCKQSNKEIDVIYSIDGRKSYGRDNNLRIIRYKDGHTKKVK